MFSSVVLHASSCLSPRRGEVSRSDGEGPRVGIFPSQALSRQLSPRCRAGRAMRLLQAFFYGTIYQVTNGIKFAVYLSVAETKHLKSKLVQSFIPHMVTFFSSVFIML